MKETVVVIDQDPTYSKKFCNQAIKLYGKKFLFLTFQNVKTLKEYVSENKIEALIVSDDILEYVEDIKVSAVYVLNEKNKLTRREGKKTYIYKLQNIKEILSLLEKDFDKKNERKILNEGKEAKIVLFYSPIYIKNKLEILKKMAKVISKKYKTIILDIDEFDNYKKTVGLSNIIYNYKEERLSADEIRKEIVCEKDQDFIRSVTYPEDFSVITNIDLANIVNEMKGLEYDYVFVNSDTSFIKCQYIANDADKVILINDKSNEKVDNFKNYVKTENQLDIKKITEYENDKSDKSYTLAFIKGIFEENVQ